MTMLGIKKASRVCSPYIMLTVWVQLIAQGSQKLASVPSGGGGGGGGGAAAPAAGGATGGGAAEEKAPEKEPEKEEESDEDMGFGLFD